MLAMKPPAFASAALLGALLLAPCLASAATLTRGPYLQMGNDSAMTLRWRSDTATNSRVKVGTDPANLNLTFDDAASTTEHVLRVTGLAANTKYYYSVGSTTQTLIGDTSTYFETAPVPGSQTPVRVWVIGDAGTGSSSQTAVRDAYANYTGSTYTDLWLQLGDNAYSSGTDAEYQAKMFNIYSTMLKKSPTWPTLGNHDGASADSGTQSGPYYDIFTLPKNAESGGIASGTEAYYSYDYANIHFVVLDSYDSSRAVGSPMLSWLESDLQATSADWIVAYWHHPPYSKGSHNSDTETGLIDMRQNVLPILENHGVDLVLSGHSHSYERSKFIDEHYGSSSTFSDATHVVQAGSGRVDQGGAYAKPAGGAAHAGAVYAVPGSSGQTSGGTLNHPAHYVSLNVLGSMVLDVNGLTLNARFLDNTGATRDYFTISKGAPSSGTVSGLSWQESDGDGVRETGETLLQGKEVRLYTATNTLVSTQTTAAGGTYAFTGIAPGNYYVQFIAAGASFAPQNAGGNDAIDSDASPADGKTAVFGVTAGGTVANTDAGFVAAGGGATTVELQNGLNGYAGNDDSYVASGSSVAGSNFGSATTLLADADDGPRDRLVSLLKWNLASIPAGSTLTAASLTLQVANSSSGTYNLRGMNAPWTEATVSWNNSNPALNQGSILGSLVPSAIGSYTITLNSAGLALLQGWIDGAANNGLMIIDTGSNNGVDFRAAEYASVGERPRLSISYQ
jgi:hypothetical protein